MSTTIWTMDLECRHVEGRVSVPKLGRRGISPTEVQLAMHALAQEHGGTAERGDCPIWRQLHDATWDGWTECYSEVFDLELLEAYLAGKLDFLEEHASCDPQIERLRVRAAGVRRRLAGARTGRRN